MKKLTTKITTVVATVTVCNGNIKTTLMSGCWATKQQKQPNSGETNYYHNIKSRAHKARTKTNLASIPELENTAKAEITAVEAAVTVIRVVKIAIAILKQPFLSVLKRENSAKKQQKQLLNKQQ